MKRVVLNFFWRQKPDRTKPTRCQVTHPEVVKKKHLWFAIAKICRKQCLPISTSWLPQILLTITGVKPSSVGACKTSKAMMCCDVVIIRLTVSSSQKFYWRMYRKTYSWCIWRQGLRHDGRLFLNGWRVSLDYGCQQHSGRVYTPCTRSKFPGTWGGQFGGCGLF